MKDKVCIRPSEFDTPWCIDEDINSGGVEYIRKEALLEWLESKVYEHNEDRFDDGFNAALGQVIDKLNEM